MKRSNTIRTGLILLSAMIVVFLAARLFFLPNWIKNHIESEIGQIQDYAVEYRDYEISVLNASYTLKDVTLVKKKSNLPLPFFQSEEITIGFDIGSLMTDRWVSNITVDHPVLNFINGPDEISSQTKISSEWVNTIAELASFPVNQMEIIEGVINYHDFHAVPRVLLSMREINLRGDNLYNSNGAEKILSGTVEGSGKVSDGTINIKMDLNAFYQVPMFKMTAELNDLNLADVSDFLQAYGNVSVQQGVFSLYTEASTKNNKIIGYVKPVIEDITIASLEKGPSSGINLRNPATTTGGQAAWAVSVDNNNANEISFEGTLDQPGLNLWSAAAITLHNAFIEALMASLESAKGPDSGKQKSVRPKAQTPAKVSAAPEKKEKFLKRIFKRKDKRKRDQN